MQLMNIPIEQQQSQHMTIGDSLGLIRPSSLQDCLELTGARYFCIAHHANF
jgi:hypothetical protein